MSPLILFALIPAYAFADRAWGSIKGGRAMALGICVAAAVLGYFVAGPTLAVLALAWAPYRSLGFAKGAAAPLTDGQRLKAFLRHLPVVPVAIPAAVWGHTNAFSGAGFMGAYAFAATALALWYGDELSDAMKAGKPIGNQNMVVESARGAFYGLALLAIALVAT